MPISSTARYITDDNVLLNDIFASDVDFVWNRDNIEAEVKLTDTGKASIRKYFKDPETITIKIHYDVLKQQKSSFVKKVQTAGSTIRITRKSGSETIKKTFAVVMGLPIPTDDSKIVDWSVKVFD